MYTTFVSYDSLYNEMVLQKIIAALSVVFLIGVIYVAFYPGQFSELFKNSPQEGQPDEVVLIAGQREGSFMLHEVGTDSVSGLNFMDYPVAREEGFPLTLRIGETVSNGCTIMLTLVRIDGSKAIFIKRTDFEKPCPICLAEGTFISTPTGDISVEDIAEGHIVWTVDGSGGRVSAPVAKISRVRAGDSHRVVYLMLRDGRELFVSPHHPTADGQVVGNLKPGDVIDGGTIVAAETVLYAKEFTYDVLPEGETGFYFANGILMGSTLRDW